jgi:beta-N-acetylhexosaminidase
MWVDSVYNQLTVEERIGQFFMIAAYTQGKDSNMDSVLRSVKQGKAGGVIFFKGMPEAQAEWTNKLQDSAKVGAFIAIDGEWGYIDAVRFYRRVSRTKWRWGPWADNKLIYEMGREIGRECKRIGLHINFAPDVDVNNNPNNPVINDRSFGEDKFKVALKGIEYADGMQDEGILACAKHFPGHGDVSTDSHYRFTGYN